MLDLLKPITNIVVDIGVITWDVGLTLLNLISPAKKPGTIVPANRPGAGGHWPAYVPPQEGDSRSACPALNAMANHGILPHDGKNISFAELTDTVRATYNFAPSFCFFVPNYCAKMLKRPYSGKCDLADLNLHNGIEHDASLTRQDVAHQPDQGKPHLPFVHALLDHASGKDEHGKKILTVSDLAAYSATRRNEAEASNKEFTLGKIHKMFGSSNSSTLLTIFGGRVEDLEPMLVEERIPDGWESRIVKPWGLTIITFNRTVSKVESGTVAKMKTA